LSDWPVERDPVFGCLLWQGKVNDQGRPVLWRGNRPVSVIREAFARARIELPPDKVPDHLCRRILCTNLDHLEPVTKMENERRKSIRYRLARRTCRKGHALNEATRVITPEMGVLCRSCLISSLQDAAAQPRVWVKP